VKIHIIRANGREEFIDAEHGDIARIIGASALDGFSLRDGRYVHIDDGGYDKNRPVNIKATELYCSICRPGTTNQIVGDVAICASGS